MGLIGTFSRLEMRPHHICSSFQELKVVRFRFVGSCQLNSCLIKSKFVSEFVGTDKPTKFVSCRFVSSCQLNSCLIKSKFVSEFVSTDKSTKFVSCRFCYEYEKIRL